MRNVALGWVVLVAASMTGLKGFSQEMPNTAGETLSGKRIVLADQVRGHAVVLVAGFSHEAGNGTGAWVKAIHSDPALASSVSVYEIAEIAAAPSLIRGMIKSGMKKGVPPAEQDYFVVLTEDARHRHRNHGSHRDGAQSRLRLHRLAPFRRNRRHFYR